MSKQLTPTSTVESEDISPFERFKRVARRVVNAPKEEVDRRIADAKASRPRRQRPK